jgi:hypothetical protein
MRSPTVNGLAVLRDLSAAPHLRFLYRITAFSYSEPVTLILHQRPGHSVGSASVPCIESCTGLRHGDPLSPLLCQLHLDYILRPVAKAADVRLYPTAEAVYVVGTIAGSTGAGRVTRTADSVVPAL